MAPKSKAAPKSKTAPTREHWLNHLATLLRPAFKRHGAPIPANVRMACSWTGQGARGRAIGQCWTTSVSADGHWEIMVSPVLDEVLEEGKQGVALVLAHELVHAAVGLDCGHRGEFKRVSEALGMAGTVETQHAGAEFVALVEPFLSELGPYPHGHMTPGGTVPVPVPVPGGLPVPLPPVRTSGPRKQGTRLLKASCTDCGYTVRVSSKWLRAGAPLCPCNSKPMGHDPVE